jgi:hypothetical protein
VELDEIAPAFQMIAIEPMHIPFGNVVIAPALAAKTVTMIGSERVSPEQILTGLTAVYGLRTARKLDGSLELTRPKVTTSQNIADLGAAVRNTIPAPLLHAFHTRLHTGETGTSSGMRLLKKQDYQALVRDMQIPAACWLRLLAEPRVSAHKDKRMPLSKLGEWEQKLFAIFLSASTLNEAYWIGDRTPPPYIADFDHIVLTGGLSRDEKGITHLALFLSYPDPKTGELMHGIGFTNARIP